MILFSEKHNNYNKVSISIGTSSIHTRSAELDKAIFAKAWPLRCKSKFEIASTAQNLLAYKLPIEDMHS